MTERIRSMHIDIDKALEMEAEIDRLGAINVILQVKIRELEEETQRRSDQWVEAIGTLRAIGHAVGCEGDELAVLAAVRKMAGEVAKLRKCVAVADALRSKTQAAEDYCIESGLYRIASLHGVEYGGPVWETEAAAYDAARAEIEKP